MKPTPVLFLDIDGTVRFGPKEMGGKFVNSPADVEVFEGVAEKLQQYKDSGWRIVGVSNQGGIAMGLVPENAVARAMQETNRLCGNLFDKMLWCNHHPDAVGDDVVSKDEKSICFCRKPRIGMILTALMDLSMHHDGEFYRPYNCLMVGDSAEDAECAANAGIPFMWAEQWRSEKV
jgi:D-glycero-D-manno-heptose 1,7-bisphosphate phosphatase